MLIFTRLTPVFKCENVTLNNKQLLKIKNERSNYERTTNADTQLHLR
jgi:hypothetical protein